jgi:hypothetical protein
VLWEEGDFVRGEWISALDCELRFDSSVEASDKDGSKFVAPVERYTQLISCLIQFKHLGLSSLH